MADNFDTNAASGGVTFASDDITGVHYPIIKLGIGALDSVTLLSGNSGTKDGGTVRVVLATDQPQLTNALKVDGSAVTQPVSIAATVTVDASGTTVPVDSELTTADLDTGAGTDTRAVVGLVLAESGGGLLVGSAHPIPISDNSGSLTVDNGGTFAVQAAQSGTWNITNVSGTVSLPTGAATAAKQPALGTAGTASSDVITVQGIASMTALKVDGSAVTQPVSDGGSTISIDDGAGNISVDWAGAVPPIGAGTEAAALRVTVATNSTGVLSVDDNGASLTVDGTVAATQSGTWTVQPGNTANTTAWKVDASSVAVPVTDNSGSLTVDNAGTFAVQVTPATSGGLSVFNGTSSDGGTALTSTAQAVKASAGQLFGWYIYNPNASAQYVNIYNTASGSVTVGTTNPLFQLVIPATSAANVLGETGIAFGTAISASATATAGGSGAPSTALECVLFYK